MCNDPAGFVNKSGKVGFWTRLYQLFLKREILYQLVLKELRIRYKESVLGIFWAFLNPLLMMLIFMVIFSRVVRIDQHHYPVFLLCGLLPWSFFSTSLAEGTTSLVFSSNLIKKVFFPREIIPLSNVIANFINFLLGLAVLFPVLWLTYHNLSTQTYWGLPLLILLQILFISGITLIFAAAHVFLRDVGNLLNILLMAWFYVTPVFYPLNLISQQFPNLQYLYLCNPMASFVVLYRHFLFDPQEAQIVNFCWVIVVISGLGFFWMGYRFFYKLQASFVKEL